MQIFGFEVRKSAPRLAVTGSMFHERSLRAAVASGRVSAAQATTYAIDPPAVTGPVVRTPMSVTPNRDLSEREVSSDPRDAYYLWLPNKLNPKQILQILRAALGGDMWRFSMLIQLMLDSWPMFRKCAHELRSPVASTRFTVQAYTSERGDQPSDLAMEKKALIERAMANFAPDRFTDEKGWGGMVYDLTEPVLSGLTIEELVWHEPTDWGDGLEVLPRACGWVHPRHFSFALNGVIGLANQPTNTMAWPVQGVLPVIAPDPRKYLCAQFRGASGSTLLQGAARSLAWYWAAVMFNREWMFVAAQNEGAPFVDYTYQAGMLKEDLARLDADIAKGLANRYIGHVEGTILNVHDGKNAGKDNYQRVLMEMADQACMELLLGTDATTKSTPGKLGDQSGGGAHDKTKRQNIETLSKWVASEPLQQFVDSVLLVNYGFDTPAKRAQALREKPTVEPDFTEDLDAMTQAQVDQVFIAGGVPVVAEDFYKRNKMQMPQPGDIVIKGGDLCRMAAVKTEEELDAANNPPPNIGPDGKPLPPGAKPGDDSDEPDNLSAKLGLPEVRKILVKATDKDLEELVPVVVAAEAATHSNGEHRALKRQLHKLRRRR